LKFYAKGYLAHLFLSRVDIGDMELLSHFSKLHAVIGLLINLLISTNLIDYLKDQKVFVRAIMWPGLVMFKVGYKQERKIQRAT